MATYTVRAPDGKTITLQGPEGASQAEIIAQAQKLYKPAAPAPLPRVQNRQVLTVRKPAETEDQRIRRVATEQARGEQDFGNAFVAGVGRSLFGLPERLAALGERYLPSSITGNTTNASYDQILKAIRARTDARAAGSTGGNILGTLTGAVTGGGAAGAGIKAVAGRLAASGAPLASRVGNILQTITTTQKGQRLANAARVSAAGAAGGAAQAAGEGSNVGQGALTGALAAPVLVGGAKVAGAVIKSGGKIAKAAARPYSDSTARALRDLVSEDPAAIRARSENLTQRVGAQVPVVAALKPGDFRAVVDRVLKKSPEAQEIAKGQSTRYVRGFMDRMLGHVNRAGREGDAQITSIGDLAALRRDTADEIMAPIADRTVDMTQLPLDDLERTLTRSIGSRITQLAPRIRQALADLSPDDLQGIDPSDIAAARRLMQQYGLSEPVHATVREMDSLRRTLDAAGKASMTSNPANSYALRNAAKTVGDFVGQAFPEYRRMVDTYAAHSRMMEGFETAASGKRINDIGDDVLRDNLRTPEGRVGMKAGELFKLREAATGRTTASMQLARDLASEGKLTRPASLAPDAAQPGTVTENLGERPAAQLADSSRAETQVMSRMLDTEKLQALAKNEDGALSPEDIVYSAFLGNALAATKARAFARLVEKLPHGFNEKVARNLADMLFSQDPAMTQQALRALERAGIGQRATARILRLALPESVAQDAAAALAQNTSKAAGMVKPNNAAKGALAVTAGNATGMETPPDPNAPAPSAADDLSIPGVADVQVDVGGETARTPEYQAAADAAAAQTPPPADQGASPYAGALQSVYDNEDPALIALVQRVKGQESSGNQIDPKTGQPVTSSKGAVGIMQVMPDTAPEAAQLAGVKWDPNAYRTDAAYNELLGIAYFSQLLRKYDGDVVKALAAYNAGPGRTDRVIAGNANLPDETQDYIRKIVG